MSFSWVVKTFEAPPEKYGDIDFAQAVFDRILQGLCHHGNIIGDCYRCHKKELDEQAREIKREITNSHKMKYYHRKHPNAKWHKEI